MTACPTALRAPSTKAGSNTHTQANAKNTTPNRRLPTLHIDVDIPPHLMGRPLFNAPRRPRPCASAPHDSEDFFAQPRRSLLPVVRMRITCQSDSSPESKSGSTSVVVVVGNRAASRRRGRGVGEEVGWARSLSAGRCSEAHRLSPGS